MTPKFLCAILLFATTASTMAQTPEESKAWEAQKAQAAAEAQARADRMAQQRTLRKADPMAWVRTLDPMSSGGWEFRTVASDGSWAIYSTEHQLKRSGHTVTIWLRQEYPEPQRMDSGGAFLSEVEKMQYDCGSEKLRALMVIYYGGNNLTGTQDNQETDPKQAPWAPVVPGTMNETLLQWVCEHHK